MIFLSGQPITTYFIWQLDLLIQNLHSLNVQKKDIHVVFSYKTAEDRSMIETFELKNKPFARVFGYSDTRERDAYPPSERAHVLFKHFSEHPELERQVFFLHDSDLLFRELPDLSIMAEGDMWYTADTRPYTGYDYLSKILTRKQLQQMARIVGVTEELIRDKDLNAGGAQWIIKNVTASFWSKMEKDCETMYEYLLTINSHREYLHNEKNIPTVQSWCADMWCILWNGWWEGRDIRIKDELNFCWPMDSIKEWDRKKILHYSGPMTDDDKRHFRKSEYTDFPPYHDHNLEKIDPSSASFPLFDSIRKYRDKFLLSDRFHLPDVTFVLVPDSGVSFTGDKLKGHKAWLQKCFLNDILIVEADRTGDLAAVLTDSKQVKTTKTVVFKDAYVIAPETLRFCLRQLEERRFIFPNFPVVEADSIFSTLFLKVLDYEILDFNLSKFPDPRKTTHESFFLFDASITGQPSIEQRLDWDPQQYVYSLKLS